jgi:hypothetical protein
MEKTEELMQADSPIDSSYHHVFIRDGDLVDLSFTDQNSKRCVLRLNSQQISDLYFFRHAKRKLVITNAQNPNKRNNQGDKMNNGKRLAEHTTEHEIISICWDAFLEGYNFRVASTVMRNKLTTPPEAFNAWIDEHFWMVEKIAERLNERHGINIKKRGIRSNV